jgi:hypothetical protein
MFKITEEQFELFIIALPVSFVLAPLMIGLVINVFKGITHLFQ